MKVIEVNKNLFFRYFFLESTTDFQKHHKLSNCFLFEFFTYRFITDLGGELELWMRTSSGVNSWSKQYVRSIDVGLNTDEPPTEIAFNMLFLLHKYKLCYLINHQYLCAWR